LRVKGRSLVLGGAAFSQMSTMTNQFDSDVQAIEPELPVTFTWMGKSLVGSRNATPDGQEMVDAGFLPIYSVEITVRTAAFAAASRTPVRNDDIQIQDGSSQPVTYRIDKILTSQDGVCLTLYCMQRN
jgi:hypothetical protein